MNKTPSDTVENRTEILNEWLDVYERFRREVEDSLDRANTGLLEVATKLMERKIKGTATEEKKSEEPVPILVKPVAKLPESQNDVVYWGM